MNGRIKWIDTIKGIAMLSVVLCHVAHGLNEAGLYTNWHNLLFSIENITDMFQMPLFTVASGFVFEKIYYANKNEVNWNKLKKQLLNLCLLYVIWEIILWIVKYVMSGHVNESVSVQDLLLAPISPIGPFWYLWLMIGLYLIFSIKAMKRISPTYVIPVLVIVGLVGSYLRNLDTWGNCFLFYAFFFYIGMLMASYEKRPKSYVYVIIAIITIALIVCLWSFEDKIYYMPFYNFIIAFGITVCVMRLVETLAEGGVCGLNYIGEHSIEVYTMHVFVTSGGRVLLKILNIQNGLIAFIILAVLGVGLPLVAAKICSKIKIYDVFFKPCSVFYRKTK
ncbi:MAG: acyltransferase [Agathobacter sp.]|nr:acyltransferase [Agathobacter sp.]